MTRYSCGLVCALAMVTPDVASCFAPQPASLSRPTAMVAGTTLFAEGESESEGQFNWLEEWAMQGKDAVALMKVQERTQRVMLAQMTEDRIYEITKLLDTMVDEATGEISESDLPKAKELAVQTRNLQKEYKDLVTGEPSTLLDTFQNLKLGEEDE